MSLAYVRRENSIFSVFFLYFMRSRYLAQFNVQRVGDEEEALIISINRTSGILIVR